MPDALVLDLDPVHGSEAIELAEWASDLGVTVVFLGTSRDGPMAEAAGRLGVPVVDKRGWPEELPLVLSGFFRP